jgi:hypothetical protein
MTTATTKRTPLSDADVATLLALIRQSDSVELKLIIYLRTMHLGPEELTVAAKFAVTDTHDAGHVAGTIDAAEARVRAAVPTAKVIYLEPDVFRPGTATMSGEPKGEPS